MWWIAVVHAAPELAGAPGVPIRRAGEVAAACSEGDAAACLTLAEAAAWVSGSRAAHLPRPLLDPWQGTAAVWLDRACRAGASEACVRWMPYEGWDPTAPRAPVDVAPTPSGAAPPRPLRDVEVRVSDGGRPAAGVTVRLVGTGRSAVTDAGGMARVPLSGGGSLEVLEGGRWGQVWVAREDPTADLDLQAAARVEAVVIGPDGAPVPGAVADVFPDASAIHGHQRAVADGAGRLTVDLPPATGMAIRVLAPDGWAYAWLDGPAAEIRLVPSVRLRLVDGAGASLPDRRVTRGWTLEDDHVVPSPAQTDGAGELPLWPRPRSPGLLRLTVDGDHGPPLELEVEVPRVGEVGVVVPWTWALRGLPDTDAWLQLGDGAPVAVIDGVSTGTRSGDGWVWWWASRHEIAGARVVLPSADGSVEVGPRAEAATVRVVDGCGAPLAGQQTSLGWTDAAGELRFPRGMPVTISGPGAPEGRAIAEDAEVSWDPGGRSDPATCRAARSALRRAGRAARDLDERYTRIIVGGMVAVSDGVAAPPPWVDGVRVIRGSLAVVAYPGGDRLITVVDQDTVVVLPTDPGLTGGEVWSRAR